jgi:uncharacterized iron-regulated protein
VRERVDVRGVPLEPLRFEGEEAFAYVDGRTGAALSFADVAARATAAELVLLGEQHDQPSHHALQARLIVVVANAHPGTVVGLEMVQWPAQPVLERFSRHLIDSTVLAQELDWKKSWGHDFEQYRPIFDQGRAAGARFVALNAPRALVHDVAVKGLEGLSDEQRAQLPELDLTDDAHRAHIRALFGGTEHGKGSKDDGRFERMYTAQVVWDESMASTAAAALVAGAPAVVVVAGNGHVAGGHGIPQRALRRRPGARLLSVVPLSVEEGESRETAAREAIARGDGDILAVPRPTDAVQL